MIAPVEIDSHPTGDVYALRQVDDPYGTAIRHNTNLSNPRFLEDGTGAGVAVRWLGNLTYATAWNQRLFSDLLPAITGRPGFTIQIIVYMLPDGRILSTEFGELLGELCDTAEVPASSTLPEFTRSAGAHRGVSRDLRSRDPISASAEANRLRDLAGLDPVTLANIFDVSRQAYYGWQRGVAPTPGHRKHLIEVLSIIEETVHRLGSSRAVGNWLLTPLASTSKRPLDYLHTRQYDVFRGLLLRAQERADFARQLPPRPRLRRELSPEHREGMRRRLRPPSGAERDDANV